MKVVNMVALDQLTVEYQEESNGFFFEDGD